MHPDCVFVRIQKPPKSKRQEPSTAQELGPLERMNNTAWRSARERAADKWEAQTGQAAPTGFRRIRVHDLKHTFGRRLRAAGVSFEDRQDLLGQEWADLRRTTRRRSLRTSSPPQRPSATRTPANLPQAPGYDVERASEMRGNFLIEERVTWCRLRDSNPRPPDYKSGALPTVLSRPLGRKNSGRAEL